jgi:hypothetical protein
MRHVVHFGDQQIFPGATNYVCLLFLAKAGADKCRFVKVDNINQWLVTLAGIEAEIPAKDIGISEWNFAVGKGAAVFKHLKQIPVKLGELAERIAQGIRTSANEVYVLNVRVEGSGHVEAHSEQLDQEVSLERKSVCRFLGGREIKSYRILSSGKVVIIPYRIVEGRMAIIPKQEFESKFPSTWAYLSKNRRYLEDRESGKMKGSNWYGFIYPKNLDIMMSPKLLVPDIADRASFALDESGTFAFTSGYGITLKEKSGLTLKFVLGLANSSVLDFYWRQVSTPLQGGFFRYFTQFIEQLPIQASTESQRRAIEVLVDYLLWLHRQPSVARSSREHPVDPDIAAYIDQWINALVYELYFPAEIQGAGLRFFELTEALKLPALDSLPAAAADRLERFRKLHKEWSGQGHRLRIALDKLRTQDLVRTIEGQA